jgi:hypothetical protein
LAGKLSIVELREAFTLQLQMPPTKKKKEESIAKSNSDSVLQAKPCHTSIHGSRELVEVVRKTRRS